MRKLITVVAILAAAAAVVFVLRSQSGTSRLTASQRDCGTARALIGVGQTVPGACKVEPLGSGGAVQISDIAAGKPLVVNFWASWCGACIQEMPDLQQVYASAAQQVQFVGLDLLGIDGEVRSAAVDFSKQRKVAYPLAYDDGGLLYQRISLRILPPTTAFVRADGTLAGLHIGQMSASELRGFISQYLGVQVAA
jgi:thiol-disulfide isomerase/thioredoxin